MPAINTARMTARQFLELGQDPPGVRLELTQGEIEVAPSPVPHHSHVVFRLGQILLNHIDEHDLGGVYGDVDTIFTEHDVRRPDIIYFRKDRLHLVGAKAIEGPPDLCVEIISATSGTIDRQVKFELYERHGVANYWLVDLQPRTFEAYALTDGRYQRVADGREQDTISAPPFPDLTIPLGKLWP
ncbi:MAG: Uma2 family endonuclease [Phycisphaeraceae bacterium]